MGIVLGLLALVQRVHHDSALKGVDDLWSDLASRRSEGRWIIDTNTRVFTIWLIVGVDISLTLFDKISLPSIALSNLTNICLLLLRICELLSITT